MTAFANEYMAWLQENAYEKMGIDPISWIPSDDPRKKIIDQLEKFPASKIDGLLATLSHNADVEDLEPSATTKHKIQLLKKALRREMLSKVNDSTLDNLRRSGWSQDEIDAQARSKDLLSDLPTLYENPFDYQLVTQAVSGIKDTMRRNPNYEGAIEKCDRVIFGTIPNGEVNAVVQAPGGEGYLALFNNGLFRFTYLLAKIVGQALEYPAAGKSFKIPRKPVNDLVRERPYLLRRLRHVVGAYVISGHPGFSRPYATSPEPSYVASRLAKCMVTFLVAHEFAHVIHGDLDDAKSVKATIGSNSVDQIPFDHQREYKADFLALDLMTRTKRAEKEPSVLIEWAPTLLLIGLHLVNNGFEILQSGDEQPDPRTDSHPTVPDRLWAVLEPLYAKENSALLPMRERAEWLIELFGLLWKELRASFEQGHELLVAPAAIWLGGQRSTGRGQAVSVYSDSSRVRSAPCHKLMDADQALAVGDYIWQMGDRHAAAAAWRCAINLGQETAARRIARSENFDSALDDEVVFS